jgi:hypothetical protein
MSPHQRVVIAAASAVKSRPIRSARAAAAESGIVVFLRRFAARLTIPGLAHQSGDPLAVVAVPVAAQGSVDARGHRSGPAIPRGQPAPGRPGPRPRAAGGSPARNRAARERQPSTSVKDQGWSRGYPRVMSAYLFEVQPHAAAQAALNPEFSIRSSPRQLDVSATSVNCRSRRFYRQTGAAK